MSKCIDGTAGCVIVTPGTMGAGMEMESCRSRFDAAERILSSSGPEGWEKFKREVYPRLEEMWEHESGELIEL
jgi:hypothetical protein